MTWSIVTESGVPFIVVTLPLFFLVHELPPNITYHWPANMTNTTGTTSGSGSAYPSGILEITFVLVGFVLLNI